MTHSEKVLRLLSDGEPHTHMEGYRLGVMLHSRVADLRKPQNGGHHIVCWRDGENYLYQLVTVQEGELASGGEPSGSPLGQSSSIRDCPPEASLHGEVSEPGSSLTTPSSLPGTGPAQLTVWEAA